MVAVEVGGVWPAGAAAVGVIGGAVSVVVLDVLLQRYREVARSGDEAVIQAFSAERPKSILRRWRSPVALGPGRGRCRCRRWRRPWPEYDLAHASAWVVIAVRGSGPWRQLEERDEFGVAGQRDCGDAVDVVSCLGQDFVGVHAFSGSASR